MTASLLPLLTGHPEVVVLIDRGGAGGDQTFEEAAATAADAVASVLLPPPQGFLGGGAARDGSGGGDGRCCRCVGVVIANNRPGHEVFPMASPASTNREKRMRAPYPVVMISQESGQLLKGSLAPIYSSPSANSPAVAPMAPQFEAGWGAPAEMDQHPPSQLPDYLGGNSAGGGGGGGVIVSLGAAGHCPAPAAPAATTSAYSCSSSSPSTSTSSAVSYGEEDGDFEESRFTAAVSADYGYGGAPVVGYPFPLVSSGFELGRGTGRGAADEGTGGWKREEMLYRAKTLPVRFTTPIW